MTGLVAAAALIFALGAGPPTYTAQTVRAPDHVGFVVRYAPNVMERVAFNRNLARRPCMVAYTYARNTDMGRLWLHIAGPAGALDCLVIDLPRPGKDKANLIERGVWAEMDYWSGFRVCGAGWTGRARDCPVRIWVLPE